MSNKAAIFIDGGYLNKILQYEHDRAKIDYEKLVAHLTGEDNLLRTYYYNCLPYQSAKPTEEENRRFGSAQKFHDRLRNISRFEVREGRLEYRGVDDKGKKIFTQKRVDILMASDIVQLATKGKISKAILLTGDSDFLPVVKIAKNEGVEITLVHGAKKCSPHKELWTEVDQRIPLDCEMIRKILL